MIKDAGNKWSNISGAGMNQTWENSNFHKETLVGAIECSCVFAWEWVLDQWQTKSVKNWKEAFFKQNKNSK